MTVKQTRCPFCHSAFYITSLQLNAYRGQARCGQCHQIFVAADHMVSTTPSAELPSIAPTTQIQSPQTELTQANFLQKSSIQTQTTQVIEPNNSVVSVSEQTPSSAAAQSETELSETIANTSIAAASPVVAAAIVSPVIDSSTVVAEHSSSQPAIADSLAQDNESAAVVIVDDPLLLAEDLSSNEVIQAAPVVKQANAETMSEINPQITSKIITDSKAQASVSTLTTDHPEEDDSLLFSDDVGFPNEEALVGNSNVSGVVLDGTFNQNFLDDTFEDLDVLGQHELTGVEKIHKAADESWLDDLLAEEDVPEIVEELKVEPGNKRPAHINSSAAQAQISEALAQRAYPTHDEDLLTFLNRTGAVTMPSTHAEKVGYSPNARPASHRILQPTTVESNPAYFVGWGLMSLLMVGLLVAQYLYFNFETMAMNPKTSGYMTKMCAVVGCQIPYMNADEIQIKNIRLVSNKRSTQTTFKAKITNTAKLSQPFPALHLTLQENGKTVASQIIQPRQYLPNELKTLARLASKNLYPIEFTINTKRSDIDDFELKAQYY